MDTSKISKLPGVLGVRIMKHEPHDIVEQCMPGAASISFALNIGMQAVAELSDCRLLYGGNDGVTITGMRFDDLGVTIVVATQTGHVVAKSLRRVMRSAAGVKRSKPTSVSK